MTSFQLSVSPRRKAAARFVERVRHALVEAVLGARKDGLRQTDVARALDVHRSVINRQLRGREDISVGRIAEIAWALGLEPEFSMRRPVAQDRANTESQRPPVYLGRQPVTSTNADFRNLSAKAA